MKWQVARDLRHNYGGDIDPFVGWINRCNGETGNRLKRLFAGETSNTGYPKILVSTRELKTLGETL